MSSVVAALPLIHHATALLVRRWDAGPPGGPRRPEPKEATGAVSISREPAPPTISRTRDSNRCESEGGASPTLRRQKRPRRPELSVGRTRSHTHPRDLEADGVNRFLTHLAVKENGAASTQRQTTSVPPGQAFSPSLLC